MLRTLLLVVGMMFTLASAMAVSATPESTLEALFRDESVAEDRFAESFLAQVPAAQVAQIVAALKRDLGLLERTEARGTDFTLHFTKGTVRARLSLDGDGRIAGLWFGEATPAGGIASLAAAIRALPGRTSLLVVSDGKAVESQQAETPLAVGSAMKLAVLDALRRAVADGRLSWSQVVELDPAWRSLPSGQLQAWPAGTPLTIASLAHLMISISDNTATDALIRLAGREQVEAVTPRNAPFLTTREAFVLKAAKGAALRRQWTAGDAPARRALLATLAEAPLPAAGDLTATPTPEIEWFLSAKELCTLLDATADLPSVGINPGLADAEDWQAVAYKGGSEPGVLNLSTRVVGRDGRVHCVVATWNDERPLDEQRLFGPYRGLLARLAAGTP
ncbi:serine hydrolase [Pelagibius sp. 7325]|uniref:serine hydrolase n=1 Tax=Pelagibius sp. 7325 TaxID=3131994 RepID=UPI0030EB5B0E